MALYNGGAFDLAKFMTNLPFSTTGLGREKHIPGWQFAGPGTELAARFGVPEDSQEISLSEDEEPWSKPVNFLDEQAKYHDIRYYNIERDSSLAEDEKLDAKHKADEAMVAAIREYSPNGLKERFFRWVIMNCLKFKVHFGLGFTPEEAQQVASEMHSRIIHKFPRRKVQVNHIDEIHAGDLMDFSKAALYYKRKRYTYVLVNVDVFSKFCWCFVIPNKSVGELKWAYEQIWKERKPTKVWFDRERAIDSHEFEEFLAKNNVELYHTYSEIKCSVAERMIRTLKEKCEKIKTEYDLVEKPYNLVEVLPEVLRKYNFEAEHSALHITREDGTTEKLTPAEASSPSNEPDIRKHYQKKYDDYSPKSGHRFEVDDVVRIYKFKTTFEKGTTSNWTSEKFKVTSIHDTKPITYTIEDLKGEPVEGKFYAWEMRPTAEP
jgi:transposase InsO family protein